MWRAGGRDAPPGPRRPAHRGAVNCAVRCLAVAFMTMLAQLKWWLRGARSHHQASSGECKESACSTGFRGRSGGESGEKPALPGS